MTFEDFAESVAAGWLPLAWGHVWHWVATHIWPLVLIGVARLRR